jgi:hypothetical protein
MPTTLKKLITFRISNHLALMLRGAPYKRHKGKLVRLLLEAYFNNELPLVKYRFEKELNNG